ncbi:Conserved_hypothetical protein [Hexamita inflata]|uniref:Transmembrane protein n=1 Tax=Hexamita inflata TaxID=28002 RepID=A0AA86NXA0_9EUKA|nr:Conserved hypothetical protein [Hexamita inflata]
MQRDVYWPDQLSRCVIIDSQTNRVIIDPFAQYAVQYFKLSNGTYQIFHQLLPVVFNHSDLSFTFSDQVRATKSWVYEIVTEQIFVRRELTKYQKFVKLKNYNVVFTLSSKALSYLWRTACKQCDIKEQGSVDQIQLFTNHVSHKILNITDIRSVASPSHLKINPECPNKYASVCLGNTSQFLSLKHLITEKLNIKEPEAKCALNKSNRFNFNYDQEILIQNLTNLENLGNMTEFMSNLQLCIKLAGNGQVQDAFELPLIKFIIERTSPLTLLDYMNYKNFVKKIEGDKLVDVMFDEIVPDYVQTVIPAMVLDVLYRAEEISIFTALTYNLEKIIDNSAINEVQVGYVSNDAQDVTYRNIMENFYAQNISDNDITLQPPQIQKMIVQRINSYLDIIQRYQLHYFSFSSGNNWIPIMNEQLKAHPQGLTEKFRIGQVNGLISVTKALTVSSKTLDNQTTINGYLTIVINTPYSFLNDNNFTIFDMNMRYISGINDVQYINGVQQQLENINYISGIQVNYTVTKTYQIWELNHSFWNDAHRMAKLNKFQLLLSMNKSTYNQEISIEDYNNSGIHERAIITDLKSDYFYSGKILVKQFGAIDAILVIYIDEIQTNSKYNNIKFNQFQNLDNLSFYYNDLNNRKSRTSYSIQQVPKYKEIQQIIFKRNELTLMYFTYIFPIITLILLYFVLNYYNMNYKTENYYKYIQLLTSDLKSDQITPIINKYNSFNTQCQYFIQKHQKLSNLQINIKNCMMIAMISIIDLMKHQVQQMFQNLEVVQWHLWIQSV